MQNPYFWIMRHIARLLFTVAVLSAQQASGQTSTYELAVLQYRGGGDWYANPTSLENLAEFCNRELGMNINPKYAVVEAGSRDLLNYPFVHMTGHGNVEFNEAERENLRTWLRAGGFLHIDDNYGMDPYVRRELAALFPNNPLVELAADHSVFQAPFKLEKGLPKIHMHEGDPPQAFGIYIDGRLAVLYTSESDLGDGWEDPEVHNDPQELRIQALQMGANIVTYAFNGSIHVQNN